MPQDVQSLRRGLAVLQALDRPGTTTLPALALELEMPLSSVHRLVHALVDAGFASRHGRGRYGIGTAALSIGSNNSLAEVLTHAGRPILAELARRCRACTHLGVLDGDMVTYLVKHPFGRMRVLSAENTQLEAYCTGIGKVLLAHLPDARLESYLAQGELVRLTPQTVTEPAALRAGLKQIRELGWAMDDEEMVPGLRCVAVPVFDKRRQVIAAVSASELGTDLSPMRIDELRRLAGEAAQQLAGRLYPPGSLTGQQARAAS